MLRLMRMVDWRTTRRCFTATAMNGAGTLPTGGESVHGTWKDGCSADPKWRRGGTAASGSDGVARETAAGPIIGQAVRRRRAERQKMKTTLRTRRPPHARA